MVLPASDVSMLVHVLFRAKKANAGPCEKAPSFFLPPSRNPNPFSSVILGFLAIYDFLPSKIVDGIKVWQAISGYVLFAGEFSAFLNHVTNLSPGS